MEADIATLRREGILVDEDNNPAPENVMHFWWCLAYPLITHLFISWRQSLASDWEIPCWEDQAEDDYNTNDAAHVLARLMHEVELNGVN